VSRRAPDITLIRQLDQRPACPLVTRLSSKPSIDSVLSARLKSGSLAMS
jgi:hypothetical protein